MEVVPVLSSTVLSGTGGVHQGGPCPLKHCVVGYWRCTSRWALTYQALYCRVLAVYIKVGPVLSSTVLSGTGGVHQGGPCPIKHCVVGYWRCTSRWALSSQVLYCRVLAVYIKMGPVLSSTVLSGTGGVHQNGPCPLNHCVTGYWRCT